jgi:hypothetical protein
VKQQWKADSGAVFNSKEECIVYEQGEMIIEQKRNRLEDLMIGKSGPPQSVEGYAEWIVRMWDAICEIMNEKKYLDNPRPYWVCHDK